MLVYSFFFKQKTSYEMRISDWSSDVVLFRSFRNVNLAGGHKFFLSRPCLSALGGRNVRHDGNREGGAMIDAKSELGPDGKMIVPDQVADAVRTLEARKRVMEGKRRYVREDRRSRRNIKKKKIRVSHVST